MADIFFSARLRFTALYLVAGVVTIVLSRIIVTYEQADGTSFEFELGIFNIGAEIHRIWVLDGVVLAAFVVAAYFFSLITLRPIEKAHTEQRRFIANVSHELRTPLSILKANAEVALIKGDRLTLDEAREVIASNIEEVNRMSKIIQFFLNFSLTQDGGGVIAMSYVNLAAIARKTIDILQKRVLEKGLSLDYVDRGPAMVYGNATALEELLLNLIKNAANYTPKGGAITVATDKTFGGNVVLTIADTGVGIAASELPHIFEPFFRGAAGSTTIRKGGVGLGLAIVHEIARMHRAKINVESKVGQGTTFTLRFPHT